MKLVRMLRAPEGEEKGAPAPEKKDVKSEKGQSNIELAKALQDLKANSVSKEDYDKLAQENRELIDQVINGGGAHDGDQRTPTEEKVDVEQLKKELYGPAGQQLSNLEVIEKTLKLRKAVIEKDGVDPFLPIGANIKPNDFDKERAQAVADVLEECVKEAQGDSGVFTAILQSKIANDSILLTNHLKKLGIKYN